MKEILIFAGTTEGRTLSECLAASKIPHTVCVATEYGEIVLKDHPQVTIHRGRMDGEEIRRYIQNGNFAAVVDATHPYATLVTENIKQALHGMEIPYLRLKRDIKAGTHSENIICFDSTQACAKALQETTGNILLTTGSKELSFYCKCEEVKQRLYVRVLPGIESLTLCMEQGICGKQILAMQGPFSVEMNEAIIHQFGISCLVTKASGASGGYEEKLEAAKRAGIPVYVVGHPQEEGDCFGSLCDKLEIICGQKISDKYPLEIVLAGIGMGNRDSMTKEVYKTIENADILLGAKRMLTPYTPKIEKRPFYQAEQIIPYLKEVQENYFFKTHGKVVILFSGDSGFYSGCQSLYRALKEEIEAGHLRATLKIMPGISSVAYLAACIGESYQDASICSMHGKELPDLVRKIQSNRKNFLLMSGAKDVRELGRRLTEAGLHTCEVVTGYQLSYPEQEIDYLTPKECCEVTKDGLYICFIKNICLKKRTLTHGMADGEFIRDKVPMTKEEIREVSICKLKLHKDAVVYDIGSGTGSIAVEIAGLSDDIQVYAIEKKEEAVELIEKNRDKFRRSNLTVVRGEAPEELEGLPMPTHAFIGGSGGKTQEILERLYRMNPRMRIVINAISMETICEIKELLSRYSMEKEEVVQLQVNRAGKVGAYHLMQAENPVWIGAFNFVPEMREE